MHLLSVADLLGVHLHLCRQGGERKGKKTGFFSDMNDLALALSPIVGGLVSILSFFLPIYVLSLTSFTAFAVVSIRLKETPKLEKAPLKLQISKLSS